MPAADEFSFAEVVNATPVRSWFNLTGGFLTLARGGFGCAVCGVARGDKAMMAPVSRPATPDTTAKECTA